MKRQLPNGHNFTVVDILNTLSFLSAVASTTKMVYNRMNTCVLCVSPNLHPERYRIGVKDLIIMRSLLMYYTCCELVK